MTRRVGLLVAMGAIAAAGLWWIQSPPLVRVPPGVSVDAAVRGVPEGSIIHLLPGRHGPFRVPQKVTVEGLPGAVVRGPVEIAADGAQLIDVRVEGGEAGVEVRDADEVVLERVQVHGARLNGIEVISGSATIRNCHVTGLRSGYGRGINIRNTNGRPRTVVEGCRVNSGQEGLVSHVGRVEFRDNIITGTTLRAISVNEMSEGLVERNLVHGAVGIAVYCGDMSHCDVRGNTVREVTPDVNGARSRQGYGLVVWYHSKARAVDNRFDVPAPQAVGLFLDSTRTDQFPLSHWPPGWRGALSTLGVAAAALASIFLIRMAVGPWVRRRQRRAIETDRRRPDLGMAALAVLTAGFVAQSFHMLEHGVQVFQVYVAHTENQSGILGARVDVEWVHFVYNTGVLVFLVWAWRLARPSGPLGIRLARSLPWLAAAVLVQSYHWVEHVAKMYQHLGLGIDPAPGILGGLAGLVWFHFGINLVVYVGMAVPLAGVALSFRLPRRGVLAPVA